MENKDVYDKAVGVTELKDIDPQLTDTARDQVADAIRVIENEDQAKEYLKKIQLENEEIEKLPPAERKLRRQKQLAETFEQMDKIWKGIGRKRRRNIMDKKQKYSARIKKRLK